MNYDVPFTYCIVSYRPGNPVAERGKLLKDGATSRDGEVNTIRRKPSGDKVEIALQIRSFSIRVCRMLLRVSCLALSTARSSDSPVLPAEWVRDSPRRDMARCKMRHGIALRYIVWWYPSDLIITGSYIYLCRSYIYICNAYKDFLFRNICRIILLEK